MKTEVTLVERKADTSGEGEILDDCLSDHQKKMHKSVFGHRIFFR